MKKTKFIYQFHWPLLIVLLILLAMGLMNLYSASMTLEGGASYYFKSQLRWSLLGLALMVIVLSIHYRNLKDLAVYLYALSIVLLALVLVFGRTIGGQTNWLVLGSFQLQPSEFAKIALILMLSKFFHESKVQGPYGLKDLLKPLAILVLPLCLILATKDVGAAIFFVAIGVTYFLVVGVRWRILVLALLLTFLGAASAYHYFLSPYQRDRIQTFLNPEIDPHGRGYHLIQSKVAVGSGALLGKGYLKGKLNKFKFLPERHTDFVFPVLAEEWGFVGSMVLLLTYVIFFMMLLYASGRARDRFGGMVILGVTAFFFWQWVINLGGVLGLLPLAGVTLPFLSYGGSALLTAFIAMGLVFGVHLRRHMF